MKQYVRQQSVIGSGPPRRIPVRLLIRLDFKAHSALRARQRHKPQSPFSLRCNLSLSKPVTNKRRYLFGLLGIANANGDRASWSRPAGNLPACRHEEPNGDPPRRTATDDRLLITDH